MNKTKRNFYKYLDRLKKWNWNRKVKRAERMMMKES
jgi:hypothetical protein